MRHVLKRHSIHDFYNFAPIGYLLIEPTGVVADANIAACAAVGRAADDIIGKPLENLVAQDGFSFEDFLSSSAVDGYVEKAPLALRHADGSLIEALVNARVDDDSILFVFDDVTEKNKLARDRERLIAELKEALDRIQTLTGILPICASCKKIRTDRGEWQQIEVYIQERTEAEFSHGICPECVRKLYPQF